MISMLNEGERMCGKPGGFHLIIDREGGPSCIGGSEKTFVKPMMVSMFLPANGEVSSPMAHETTDGTLQGGDACTSIKEPHTVF